jgi:hypothetical protein
VSILIAESNEVHVADLVSASPSRWASAGASPSNGSSATVDASAPPGGAERSAFRLVFRKAGQMGVKLRGIVMTAKKSSGRKWSAKVTEHSDALDLKHKVFKGSPAQIAASLKRSAEHSRRRKSSPFRSAMSMLTFYINRAGKNLSATRRKKLETAKDKLREAFGHEK